MKKLLFSALFAIAIASSAFAAPSSNVNANILSHFKSSFHNATDITWTSKEDFAKATFTLDNIKMEAFYNATGDLIGTSKNIGMEELPVNAKRSFAKKFQNYTVKEAIHFEGVDETAYYISAENDVESVIVRVAENEQMSTYKKTRK